MANLLIISGPASALLLLAALLAAGARADYVTSTKCKERGVWGRLREYPVDSNATELYMVQCGITGIQEQTLTGLPALKAMYLHWNHFRELPVLGEHVCRNLTVLSLYINGLTSINNAGAISACTKLEILHLFYNQIEFIHRSVFTTLINLKQLTLNNNKIRCIPDQMFSNNGQLGSLFLHSNRLTRLPPGFATSLKRTSPGLDRFHFHDNPWHCTCLLEVLADVKRAGVRDYNAVSYDGTRRVCAFSGAVPCHTQTGLGDSQNNATGVSNADLATC